MPQIVDMLADFSAGLANVQGDGFLGGFAQGFGAAGLNRQRRQRYEQERQDSFLEREYRRQLAREEQQRLQTNFEAQQDRLRQNDAMDFMGQQQSQSIRQQELGLSQQRFEHEKQQDAMQFTSKLNEQSEKDRAERERRSANADALVAAGHPPEVAEAFRRGADVSASMLKPPQPKAKPTLWANGPVDHGDKPMNAARLFAIRADPVSLANLGRLLTRGTTEEVQTLDYGDGGPPRVTRTEKPAPFTQIQEGTRAAVAINSMPYEQREDGTPVYSRAQLIQRYQQLLQSGIPPEMLTGFLSGLAQRQQQAVEGYQQIVAMAANMTPQQQQEAVNALLAQVGMSENELNMILDGQAQYAQSP